MGREAVGQLAKWTVWIASAVFLVTSGALTLISLALIG